MPANPNRGEIAFELEGVEYIFKFGINAQAIIEDKSGESIGTFLQRMQKGFGAKDIRLIFYASLAEHHKLTEQEVGDLIDQIGGQRASEIFMAAARLAEAKQRGVVNGAGDEPPRPTKAAKERIGMNS